MNCTMALISMYFIRISRLYMYDMYIPDMYVSMDDNHRFAYNLYAYKHKLVTLLYKNPYLSSF